MRQAMIHHQLERTRLLKQKKHNPGGHSHDQSSHGRRGREGVSRSDGQSLVEKLRSQGGFTYQPASKNSPTNGFSIGVFPESEVIFGSIEEATAAELFDYMADHFDQFQSDHRIHFGGWYNKKTDDNPQGDDKVYLDLSLVISDRVEAIDLAKNKGQLAIFDLGSGEPITTLSKEEREEWERNNEHKSHSLPRNPRYDAGGNAGGGDSNVRDATWPQNQRGRASGTGQAGGRTQSKSIGLSTFDGGLLSRGDSHALDASIGAVSSVISAAESEMLDVENPEFIAVVNGIIADLSAILMELEGVRETYYASIPKAEIKCIEAVTSASWHRDMPSSRRAAAHIANLLDVGGEAIRRSLDNNDGMGPGMIAEPMEDYARALRFYAAEKLGGVLAT